ncbi:hypothetical protein PS925_01721 [Pseudomonas fluorescens]|uniref:Uncharacterized protein n=1 Tax=Pseudomonas fluorescens TaxID=294 RepID=A0A5E7T8Y4_PSEFL|nr:hypothetical protein PS925_01721 [Pseudomonas fluorescens]
MLSTEAPTEFGGNFALSVEKPWRLCEIEVYVAVFNGNRRIDCFLIIPSKATFCMGFSG